MPSRPLLLTLPALVLLTCSFAACADKEKGSASSGGGSSPGAGGGGASTVSSGVNPTAGGSRGPGGAGGHAMGGAGGSSTHASGSASTSTSGGGGGGGAGVGGHGGGPGPAGTGGMGGALAAGTGGGPATTGATTTTTTSGAGGGGNPNRKPCTNGPGWIAFQFHYEPNGNDQAFLDDFGLPDNSNWEAVPAFATMVADANNGGGLEVGSGNWILIRYSVVGLTTINSATFSILGRSYDVSASGSFDAWSPLYGDDPSPTDSVSNAWPYTWTTVDFSASVHPGDDPGLTGIRLYSGPSSSDLVIHTVQLCIDGN